MPRPPRIHRSGCFYHVMSRGNAGRSIFLSETDYRLFLFYLEEARRLFGFELHAYCLMPNHFHLFLRMGKITLTVVMQRLLSRYAAAFNTRVEERGHVFQGRFKSLQCLDEAYFLSIVRYIHLNPVKAGLVQKPEAWLWSSLSRLLGEESEPQVSRGLLRSMLGHDPVEIRRWVLGRGGSVELPEALESGLENGRRMEDLRTEACGPTQAEPDKEDEAMASLEVILAEIAGETGIDAGSIVGHCRARRIVAARDRFIYRGVRSGRRIAEIAAFLGCSHQAASLGLQREGLQCGGKQLAKLAV